MQGGDVEAQDQSSFKKLVLVYCSLVFFLFLERLSKENNITMKLY